MHTSEAVSLRHCEWGVCGRGQTVSKPFVHIAPPTVYETTRAPRGKTFEIIGNFQGHDSLPTHNHIIGRLISNNWETKIGV
jgi:hypothetical protein